MLQSWNEPPRLENISATSPGGGMIQVDFTASGIHAAGEFRAIAYLDGEVSADTLLGGDGQPGYLEFGPVGDGGHDINFVVQRSEEFVPPYYGDDLGNRVLLFWQPSASTDVTAYRIYSNGGDGSIDYTAPIATVSRVSARRFANRAPSSGTGTGRISVRGVYRGTVTNDTVAVEVTAGGKFEVAGTEVGAIRQNQPATTSDGLIVTFIDPVGNYDTGDTWAVPVRVDTHYITEALDVATYNLAVRAVDAAGNESTTGPSGNFVVPEIEAAPSNVTASYNSATGVITIEGDMPLGVNDAEILSNWNYGTETLLPYVSEYSRPLPNFSSITIDTGDGGDLGEFFFRIRSQGNDENLTLYSLNCVESPPATAVDPPYEVAGVAIADGDGEVSWKYDLRETVPDSFSVYRFAGTTAGDFGATTPTSVAVDTTDQVADIVNQTWATGTQSGNQYYVVRAVLDGEETDNTDGVLIAHDATAPAAPTGLGGGIA